VREPDSVGVRIARHPAAELVVVLFRGGWADVDFVAGTDEADVVSENPLVRSPPLFGELLDGYVLRAFGPPGTRAAD
jgi:hypothetical protein